jgi:hypothetical protein
VSGYLRQLARQATGEHVPGQPRPLLQPNSPGPVRGETDTGLVEAYEERSEPREEADHPPTRAKPSRPSTVTPSSQPVFATPERLPPQPPADLNHDSARQRGTDPAPATPSTLQPRLDAIEILLPAQSRDKSPGGQDDHKVAAAADRDTTEHAPVPVRPATATTPLQASPARNDDRRRERNDDRRKPEPAAPTPEVHIHIGRVELTALQTPHPKSAPRSTGKKPMSLDDYLRQRDTRRS